MGEGLFEEHIVISLLMDSHRVTAVNCFPLSPSHEAKHPPFKGSDTLFSIYLFYPSERSTPVHHLLVLPFFVRTPLHDELGLLQWMLGVFGIFLFFLCPSSSSLCFGFPLIPCPGNGERRAN